MHLKIHRQIRNGRSNHLLLCNVTRVLLQICFYLHIHIQVFMSGRTIFPTSTTLPWHFHILIRTNPGAVLGMCNVLAMWSYHAINAMSGEQEKWDIRQWSAGWTKILAGAGPEPIWTNLGLAQKLITQLIILGWKLEEALNMVNDEML